jgi:hypothetical protein
MTDTSPEIEKIYNEMMMKRSNIERFMMGIEMFESAKKIVIASFPKDLSRTEFKEKLFLRFYENDFSKEELEKIIEWIRKNN